MSWSGGRHRSWLRKIWQPWASDSYYTQTLHCKEQLRACSRPWRTSRTTAGSTKQILKSRALQNASDSLRNRCLMNSRTNTSEGHDLVKGKYLMILADAGGKKRSS